MNTITIPCRDYIRLMRDAERWKVVNEAAEHTDDHDMQPVFTVDLNCDWRLASKPKGFQKCVDAVIEGESE